MAATGGNMQREVEIIALEAVCSGKLTVARLCGAFHGGIGSGTGNSGHMYVDVHEDRQRRKRRWG